MSEMKCPICTLVGAQRTEDGTFDGSAIVCRNCGTHRISGQALAILSGRPAVRKARAGLAYAVQRVSPETVLTTELIDALETTKKLPEPLERIELLLTQMADQEPGFAHALGDPYLSARLGCESDEACQWVVKQAMAMKLVEHEPRQGHVLTASGWAKVDELRRAGSRSRHAFMAMAFGDEQMKRVYRDLLRPAVRQAGFDLRTTNEDHKTAGSIDNRMRVELRTSRFVVCDLTHGNRGAYWESGFAEGLGRPVFYVCRKDVLQDEHHKDRPHFDTAHQLIVGWDEDSPQDAIEELTAVIRATIPSEAKLED